MHKPYESMLMKCFTYTYTHIHAYTHTHAGIIVWLPDRERPSNSKLHRGELFFLTKIMDLPPFLPKL